MNEVLEWRAGDRVIPVGLRTHVMGVLNVTPDSFSDGGRFLDPDAAVSRGIEMVADGVDLLDVGGESTRPGAEFVPADEERGRVVPVVTRLARAVDVPISIDTRKPDVAEAALEAGASILNDVTGGSDRGMLRLAARSGAGMVLMHMRGEPATMQQLTDYSDVVAEVTAYLRQRVESAVAAGVDEERLCVDPGLGFAKTTPQSLLLMHHIDALTALGRPILVGPSRKSFVGDVLDLPVDERVEGTAASVAWMVARGAHVVRVHDVKETVRVVRMIDAIRKAGIADRAEAPLT